MTCDSWVYSLNDPALDEVVRLPDVIGGKAASIRCLMQAGFSTPPAFVITTMACRDYFARHRGWPDGLWEKVTQSVADLEQATGQSFGDRSRPLLLAVRSGAPSSMPGTMRTVLDCGITADKTSQTHWDQLRAAITGVFDSWHSAPARAYRRIHHLDDDVGTAVLIQRMVATDVAGVLFTQNPLSGSDDEVVIEAVAGLGDQLVSGIAAAQRWTVGRASCDPITPDKSAAPAAAEQSDLLTADQMRHLVTQCLQLEALFQSPVDVEWGLAGGQFVFFQVRPVAHRDAPSGVYSEPLNGEQAAVDHAVDPAYLVREQRRLDVWKATGETIWVRHNLSETVPHPTPLTWSILRDFMSGRGGLGQLYRRLGFAPTRRVCREGFLELVCGKIYASPGRIAELYCADYPFGFEMTALRGDPSTIDRAPATLDLDRVGPLFLLRLPAIVWILSRAQRRFRRLCRTAEDDYQRATRPAFHESLRRERSVTLADLTAVELVERIEQRVTSVLTEFAPRLMLPGIIGRVLFDRLEVRLTRALGKEEGLSLARRAIQRLEQAHVPPLVGALQDLSRGALSLEQFLDEFGHRAYEEMELAEPRWRECPPFTPPPTDPPPDIEVAATGDTMTSDVPPLEAAVADVRERLTRGDAGAVLADVESLLVRSAALLPYRERAKDELMRGYELIREAIVALARAIGLGPDIYFLTMDELADAANGRAVSTVIAERRHDWEMGQQCRLPAILNLDEFALGDVADESGADSDRLLGTPIGPGVAIGPAWLWMGGKGFDGGAVGLGRLVRPLERHRPVIVCDVLEPQLLPLLTMACAVVVEQANLLSHGAILARSLGLPVVAAIGATRMIRSSDQIRIDGTGGTVEILDRHQRPSSASAEAAHHPPTAPSGRSASG